MARKITLSEDQVKRILEMQENMSHRDISRELGYSESFIRNVIIANTDRPEQEYFDWKDNPAFF
jgi:transposase